MAHELMQHGNNSVTYFVEWSASGGYLDDTDWAALPDSRIKTALQKTFEDVPNIGNARLIAQKKYLASLGFSAVLSSDEPTWGTVTTLVGAVGPTTIGYDQDIGHGLYGVLRLSLAYSASE